MTSIEAGIVSGFPSGAVVGWVFCRSHGSWTAVGGSLAGAVAGGVAGWLCAMLFVVLTVAGVVLHRAVRRCADRPLIQSELKGVDHVLRPGIFWGVIGTTVVGLTGDWLYALGALMGIAVVSACTAAIGCELSGRK